MTDLTNLLADIRARVEAATKGPWETRNEGPGEPWRVCHDREHVIYLGFDTVAEFTENDAEFIASARTDVPRLLAALEGVLAQCAQWEHAVSGDPSVEPTIPTARIRAAVVAALGEGK